ncbi:MAG: hypothetical protein ABW321_35540 [Polyangiales bacterium]
MGLHAEIRRAIYEQHLEEATFLYAQRRRAWVDPELTLPDVAALDDRLEAHLDGLVLGDHEARALCLAACAEEDPGTVYSTLCVLCRQNELSPLLESLEALALAEPDVLQAVGDAWVVEWPDSWQIRLLDLLARGRRELLAPLARVAGSRRWTAAGPALLAAAADSGTDPMTARVCLAAVGDMGFTPAREPLRACVDRGDPALAPQAAIALLKLGVALHPADLRYNGRELPSWASIPLALGGTISARQLEPLLDGADGSPDAALGCGLLGDPSALPSLLAALSHPPLSAAAATALLLLSGVELREQVEVVEPPDPTLDDDLVDAEAEADVRAPVNDTPVRPTTQVRLARDPVRWREALGELSRSHNPVRAGQVLSVASTATALRSLCLPRAVRQYLLDDLKIRGHVEARLCAEAPVLQQTAVWSSLRTDPTRPFRSGSDQPRV